MHTSKSDEDIKVDSFVRPWYDTTAMARTLLARQGMDFLDPRSRRGQNECCGGGGKLWRKCSEYTSSWVSRPVSSGHNLCAEGHHQCKSIFWPVLPIFTNTSHVSLDPLPGRYHFLLVLLTPPYELSSHSRLSNWRIVNMSIYVFICMYTYKVLHLLDE